MWYHVAFILAGFYLVGVGIYNITNSEGSNFWQANNQAGGPSQNVIIQPSLNSIVVNTGVTFLGFSSIAFGVHGITSGKDLVDTAKSAVNSLRQPIRDDRRPQLSLQGGRRYGGKR